MLSTEGVCESKNSARAIENNTVDIMIVKNAFLKLFFMDQNASPPVAFHILGLLEAHVSNVMDVVGNAQPLGGFRWRFRVQKAPGVRPAGVDDVITLPGSAKLKRGNVRAQDPQHRPGGAALQRTAQWQCRDNTQSEAT